MSFGTLKGQTPPGAKPVISSTLSRASDGEATSFPHHNEHFDLAQDSFPYAAALTVQYALDFLNG